MANMKDSGVEWIGEIPEEWVAEPLRINAEFTKGLAITKADLVEKGVRVISYGQVHSKTNTGTAMREDLLRFVPNKLAVGSASRLNSGDLAFADTSEDKTGLGAAAYNDTDAVIYGGYDIIICRPNQNKLYGKYLAYLALTDAWRSQLRAYTTGVKVFHVTQALLKRCYVLLPPREEQMRITAYLDCECSKLDEAYSAIETQISTLERYRASVIHEAVTRGLDPTAPTKPSNVDWIGNIPAHWRAERVAYHCALESGHTPSKLHPEWWKDEECVIPWVTTGDVHRFRNGEITTIYDTEEHVSNVGLANSSARILPAGTVALSRTASVGFSIIMGCDMASSQDFADWVPGPNVNSKYLLYVFRSMNQLFEQLKIGSTHKTIYMHVLKTLKMPLPPKDEQKAIADYLDARTAAIDAIIATKCKQLDVLKRRRQSLIYEYVTGKRRVSQEG